MASHTRTARIAEEIKKIVSKMLITEIKDPRINSLISVTDVEVTSDLSYAYIYVSILGGNQESSMLGLKSACGYIRREVSKNIKIRHVPEIIFRIDDSLEKGMRMERLIESVRKSDAKKSNNRNTDNDSCDDSQQDLNQKNDSNNFEVDEDDK
jgi:ribosome-binding factor A